MKIRLLLHVVPPLAMILAFLGCRGGASPNDDGTLVDNGFESDDPKAGPAQSSTEGGAAPVSPRNDDDATTIAREADVVKLDGNRLYALSKSGGLAILDVSDADHMKILGRKRLEAEPFEMYIENGRAFVLLNDHGRWVASGNASTGTWVSSSEIVALDVTNSAAIGEVARVAVPGRISDSRVVGDRAYVVTYESGSCWGCQQQPSTVVTSFQLGATITKRDQLVYAASTFRAGARSVSTGVGRLYVEGPEASWTFGAPTPKSLIQVVDISDTTGKLTKGADVMVAGGIGNRWQVDEHEGILRVVTQFGGAWGANTSNPRVQTFTVASSSSITPLGSTELVLPKPEALESVRFDGVRGYAITAVRSGPVGDPLFTIDLSNPAAPKQSGTLEMPGWIFHLEPRGDRLLGFGYDDAESTRLAVSLFDVADLGNPRMVKRVTFGGIRPTLPEDQDRIRKAVRVFDALGLVTVPFAGPAPGLQLVDYGRDDLRLRASVGETSSPRRTLLVKERLLTMSDRLVSAIDLTARDAPRITNEVELSRPSHAIAELTAHVASITSHPRSGEPTLAITSKDGEIVSSLSLASLAVSADVARLLANGSMLYVVAPVLHGGGGPTTGELVAAAIDVADPIRPVLLGRVTSPLSRRSGAAFAWSGPHTDGWAHRASYGGYTSFLMTAGESVVRHGTRIAFLDVDNELVGAPFGSTPPTVHRKLHVVDFANPAAPIVHPALELNDSLGATPLQVSGGLVLTSSWIRTAPTRVKFYVDRIDLRGPAPVRLPSLNTPGSLIAADEGGGRLVTADYRAVDVPPATATPPSTSASCGQDAGTLDAGEFPRICPVVPVPPNQGENCWFRGGRLEGAGVCLRLTRELKLLAVVGTQVRLDQSLPLPGTTSAASSSRTTASSSCGGHATRTPTRRSTRRDARSPARPTWWRKVASGRSQECAPGPSRSRRRSPPIRAGSSASAARTWRSIRRAACRSGIRRSPQSWRRPTWAART